MILTDLRVGDRIIIQLSWGEKVIEFSSIVEKNPNEGVLVTPYMYDGKPLELNLGPSKGFFLTVFADDPATKQRVAWKNVDLATQYIEDEMFYCLTTSGYNTLAKYDDRRKNGRIVIQKKGQVYNIETEKYTDVLIHDISDVGISFYAPSGFSASQIKVLFSDSIGDKNFDIKVNCIIARSQNKAGNVLFGCRTVGENKDYNLYGFLRKLIEKNKDKMLLKDEPNENKEVSSSEAENRTDNSDAADTTEDAKTTDEAKTSDADNTMDTVDTQDNEDTPNKSSEQSEDTNETLAETKAETE